MPIVVPPAAEIWQGDIFSDAPWAWLQTVQFVEQRGDPRHGTPFYVSCQPPQIGAKGLVLMRGGRGMGMLISHECEFDKDQPEPLTFARVLPLRRQGDQVKEQIRRLQWHSTFHLPGDLNDFEESYVDFRFVTPLSPEHIRDLTKVASLSEQGRRALREQLQRHWTRSEE